MSDVRVRVAGPADLEALVELRAEMFRAMGTSDTCGPWRVTARQWFADRLDHPDYRIMVVEAAGGVVACAVGAIRDAAPSPASPDGRDVLVSNVCTAEPFRGLGYGRAAFDAVLAWARRTGVGRAELMATEAGLPLYERAGFVAQQCVAMRATLC
ncbi:GNAT family N-acetyltransferase [Raineyella sp. LH-20]|uniref:GNAT family N-acetyltransferase n=1 Tax=Raineyella sp. LH-20 TaxID=3081204 RepID=UPI0029532642|nr:GNAT family N-acetyltransferase [Raineyella sp. LH-20]WOP18150.1 GNAT family N-acetyltransferase [Raineyella sp. LH-20]